MNQIRTSAYSITYNKRKSSYIYRDLLIWLFFLVLVPLVFISVYYLTKTSTFSVPHDAILDNTNYLDQPRQIKLDKSNLLPKEFSMQEFGWEPKLRPLMKVSLTRYKALCNDGSPASYYIRQSDSNSKEWLIVVEGGFFCYDKATCSQRVRHSRNFTSSRTYSAYKYGHGILSSSKEENKYWSDANVVSIPYCSSDLWIGDKTTIDFECIGNCTGQFHFMGHRILEAVFTDLMLEKDMKDSALVVVAGISSGGIGTLLNAGGLKQKVAQMAPNAVFKVVIDSAWLLELPYSYLCHRRNGKTESKCIIDQIFENAIKFWGAHLPDECTTMPNQWDCFLPQKLIPHLNIPIFVIQSIFDETQLLEKFRGLSTLATNDHNDFLKTTLHEIRLQQQETISRQFTKHNGFFAPSCMTHMLLTRSDFKRIRIGELFLETALKCWIHDDKNCENKIENCQWPDCSGTCPATLHPDNSLVVSPLEYLSYFGLANYEALARRLKVRAARIRAKTNYNHVMARLMST